MARFKKQRIEELHESGSLESNRSVQLIASELVRWHLLIVKVPHCMWGWNLICYCRQSKREIKNPKSKNKKDFLEAKITKIKYVPLIATKYVRWYLLIFTVPLLKYIYELEFYLLLSALQERDQESKTQRGFLCQLWRLASDFDKGNHPPRHSHLLLLLI